MNTNKKTDDKKTGKNAANNKPEKDTKAVKKSPAKK